MAVSCQTRSAHLWGLFVVVECVIPGAGAFEVAASAALMKFKETVKGRARLGVQAYAEALLIIPKTLAINSGFDAQESMVKLLEEYSSVGQAVGLDLDTGGYYIHVHPFTQQVHWLVI